MHNDGFTFTYAFGGKFSKTRGSDDDLEQLDQRHLLQCCMSFCSLGNDYESKENSEYVINNMQFGYCLSSSFVGFTESRN